MAQNFKRRITLLPNYFNQIQNSIEKFKDNDITEKADKDTFNKTITYNNTPVKEKRLDPSLLETPVMEKRKRRISIYSPLSFSEKFCVDDKQTESGESFLNKNVEKNLDNSTRKKITNFIHQPFQESDDDDIDNDDILKFNTWLPISKKKKKNIHNKNINNVIIFKDDNNNNYFFALFNDEEILEKDIHNKNFKYFNKERMQLKIHDVENSDEEQIQEGCNMCFKQLDEAINYYSNYPNCISRFVNINK
jgi:hypothetical protein